MLLVHSYELLILPMSPTALTLGHLFGFSLLLRERHHISPSFSPSVLQAAALQPEVLHH